MKKIPLFLVLMVLVIAPLSLTATEGRGEDHDSDDNNGYNQNQSGSTVSSYVPNQDEDVGLEGDDRGGENNSGQTPSDRQHCEKTKQKTNRMNIHNTDPNRPPASNSGIPESGAGGGPSTRVGEMGGHGIQQVDPLAGIPNNKIAAWMNARTQEGRQIAFADITGKNSSSAASTSMPQEQRERVLAALNARRDQNRLREQYNAANAVPTCLQTLSNPDGAVLSYVERRASRNAAKDLEATIERLEGVSPALLKDSIVAALQNNGKLEGAELDQLLTTINAARPSDRPMHVEQLQQEIERRVMQVPVHLANHLLADADTALLRRLEEIDILSDRVNDVLRQAEHTNNIKSALLFRKSVRQDELRSLIGIYIRKLREPALFEWRPCSTETKTKITQFSFRILCAMWSHTKLKKSASLLLDAGNIRAEAESNSDEEIKSLLLDVAQAYEADADIIEADTNMEMKLCSDPRNHGLEGTREDFVEGARGLFNVNTESTFGFFREQSDLRPLNHDQSYHRGRDLYYWTTKLIEERSAAQRNEEHIQQYENILLNINKSFKCYTEIKRLRYHFLAENANNFPLLAMSLVLEGVSLAEAIHQLPGRAEYEKAQQLFEQAADKYLEGNTDEATRLSEEAETARNEAQQLDPSFEHVSIK